MGPAERSALYLAMIETLALLHSFDLQSLGLQGYGRGPGYCKRQVQLLTFSFFFLVFEYLFDLQAKLLIISDHILAINPLLSSTNCAQSEATTTFQIDSVMLYLWKDTHLLLE